ncbi:flagellar protein FlaG [Aliikangiella sp. G2MR2-5]|uniref:flagellar protein FlaG n=1 Tax=Aliikangiella sp. G2MR2-5 TaxID=2788943 RepID=UPI0018AB8F16|nr:flagellar protein FlaG [Aliikangiella sp. G2MR2-5]
MAINPMSGNFQPLTVVSGGKSLPDDSKSSGIQANAISKAATEQVLEKESIQEVELAKAIEKKLSDGQGARELQKQLEKFAQAGQKISRSIRFQVDQDTGSTVISVIDRQTDETIRQIPPEELLTLSKRLKELNDDLSKTRGVLVKTQV